MMCGALRRSRVQQMVWQRFPDGSRIQGEVAVKLRELFGPKPALSAEG